MVQIVAARNQKDRRVAITIVVVKKIDTVLDLQNWLLMAESENVTA